MNQSLDVRPNAPDNAPDEVAGGGHPPAAKSSGSGASWWATAVMFILGGVATAIGGWYRWFGASSGNPLYRQDDGANPFTGTRFLIKGSTDWSVAGWSLIAVGMLALAVAIARDRGWGGAVARTLAVVAALTGAFAFASGPLSWALRQTELSNGALENAVFAFAVLWTLGLAPVALVGVAFSGVRGRTSGPAMGVSLTPLVFSALIVEFMVLITAEDIITANPSHDDPFGSGILMGSVVALTGALVAARLVTPSAVVATRAAATPGRVVALARPWSAAVAALAFAVLAVERVVNGIRFSTENLIADPDGTTTAWLPLGVSAALLLIAWGSLALWRWGVVGRLFVLAAAALPIIGAVVWALADQGVVNAEREYGTWARLVDMASSGIGVMIPWLILAMAAALTPRARGSWALLAWALAAAASALVADYAFGTAWEPHAAALPKALIAVGCAHVAWIAHRHGGGLRSGRGGV